MIPATHPESPIELVTSDDVRLSARLATQPKSRGLAVVCHPHPLMGGDMDNKVVSTSVRAAMDAGWDTLRFDFRGVRASGGEHGGGGPEALDVEAALRIAGQRPTALVGYSFGTLAASGAMRRGARPSRAVLIAPPLSRWAMEAPPLPPEGLVVVVGARDAFCGLDLAEAFVGGYAEESARLVVLEHADHFFHARLDVLFASVRGALS